MRPTRKAKYEVMLRDLLAAGLDRVEAERIARELSAVA